MQALLFHANKTANRYLNISTVVYSSKMKTCTRVNADSTVSTAIPPLHYGSGSNSLIPGLRAGRVRVIFRLPAWMKDATPLMYVEWFRPFRSPDPVIGLPPTSHSTRAGKRNVSIVEARDLLRPCHLIPHFGQDPVNATWTASDLLDEPISFSFNRYLDFQTFHDLS